MLRWGMVQKKWGLGTTGVRSGVEGEKIDLVSLFPVIHEYRALFDQTCIDRLQLLVVHVVFKELEMSSTPTISLNAYHCLSSIELKFRVRF